MFIRIGKGLIGLLSLSLATSFLFACEPSQNVQATPVKILSYNVLNGFDEARGDRIVGLIDDQNPEVLGLQEVIGENTEYLFNKISVRYDGYFLDTADPLFVRKDASG